MFGASKTVGEPEVTKLLMTEPTIAQRLHIHFYTLQHLFTKLLDYHGAAAILQPTVETMHWDEE